MKVIYFDCFAGFDTTMAFSALLDIYANEQALTQRLLSFASDAHLTTAGVKRCGMEALLATVTTENTAKKTDCAAIEEFIRLSGVDNRLQEKLLSFLHKKWNATAALNNCRTEQLPLSEAEEKLVLTKVLGIYFMLQELHVERIDCSRIFQSKIHGDYDALDSFALSRYLSNAAGILTTETKCSDVKISPDGAALLWTLSPEYGKRPELDIIRTGYGAGAQELEIPNILRAVYGEDENQEKLCFFSETEFLNYTQNEFAVMKG